MDAMPTMSARGTPLRRAAAALLAASVALPFAAAAQTTVATDDEPDDEYVEQAPSSTEQGQTPIDEAFAPRDRAQWVRETRRKAFKDTKWDLQARSFYLGRDKYDNTESEAWALGGSVGFKTG